MNSLATLFIKDKCFWAVYVSLTTKRLIEKRDRFYPNAYKYEYSLGSY